VNLIEIHLKTWSKRWNTVSGGAVKLDQSIRVTRMKYLMVLQVPFYKVNDDVVACESAFAVHLKELLPRIVQWGDEIVIHSPSMSEAIYQANKSHLAHIKCQQERITYVEAEPMETSRLAFFLKAPFTIWPKIWQVVKTANVVHASASKDIFKLFTIIAIISAVIQGKKTLFAMDIDHRNSARMLYRTGKFSRKSYWLSQYVYNPLIALQIRFAVRYCNLVMLKSSALVADFGKGKPNVKNFYDTAHDLSFVLSDEAFQQKLQLCRSDKPTIRLVYFGRLVAYKGIDDMIEATRIVAEKLSHAGDVRQVTLDIIGAGEMEQALRDQVVANNIESRVTFHGAVNYGQALSDKLKTYDFLLAAPKSEDTPRSVFDAMACGLPIIGYDTYYYKNLEETGAVQTVTWLSPTALAHNMIRNARQFAIDNTQTSWMDRRLQWCKEFLG
jgi:glycosyltransferase involved in cell wall biosynthesis